MRQFELPPEDVQLRFTSDSGDEALRTGSDIAKVIRWVMRTHGPAPKDCDSMLDFGCGWGRIIRFFDIENLWGIVIDEKAIKACQDTIPTARFAQVNPLGPTPFEDDTFDVAYAFSVFTHLSEEAHLAWLGELRRILRPEGLLIVTTLRRSFIREALLLRLHDPQTLPEWQRVLPQQFDPPHKFLTAYDRGEYCYVPHDGHFGNTLIPKQYVEQHWPFELLAWFPSMTQQFVVCRNPS